jgi:8-oxo-dGTP diphosphatase
MQQVTAAILIKDNKILIAKRSAKGKVPHKWEFPGGKIENGETPEECLIREMNEEFGIKINVGAYFGNSIYDYSHGEIELLAFFVEWISGSMAPAVHDEIRWVTQEELGNYDFAPADIPIVDKLLNMKMLK